MKKLIGLMLISGLAFGCGDDDVTPADGGTDGPIIELDADTPDTDTPDTDTPDVAPDVDQPDTPTSTQLTGIECSGARGCPTGGPDDCREPQAVPNVLADFLTGGGIATNDTVIDHPEGMVGVPGTAWQGGYCAPGCGWNAETGADHESCGPNAWCLASEEATSSICVSTCTLNNTDNDVCRDGYVCAPLGEDDADGNPIGVCFPTIFGGGCESDLECQINRIDTNDVPGIQDPSDCIDDPQACDPACIGVEDCEAAGMPDNFDRLTYEGPGSEAASIDPGTCNLERYRCEHPGTAGAEAGDSCTADWDCEANGVCLDFTDDEMDNSTCTLIGCDLAGCEGDGACVERGIGADICLPGCELGNWTGADATDASTWTGSDLTHADCGAGNVCLWNGTGAPGTTNGGCFPVDANLNDVANNIGAPCTEDEQCYSPFGQGFCINDADEGDEAAFAMGYCAVRDCAAPFLVDGDTPVSICGEGADCVGGFDADDPTFAICLDVCSAASDCQPGHGCVNLSGMDGGTTFCWPGCFESTDCAGEGYTCEGASATALGECVAP